DLADRALAHHHLGLADLGAALGQRLGDLARADRAVQLALGRGVGVDRDRRFLAQAGLALLGLAQQGLRLGLVLGATGLELGQVGGRGGHGLALRHQEVAAVARLHRDLVAQVAQVGHFLQEDQFHFYLFLFVSGAAAATAAVRTDQALWLSVYGIRAR